MGSSALSQLGRWYAELTSRSWIVQPCLSAAIATSGDFVAQTIGEGTPVSEVDTRRLSAFTAFGCIWSGTVIPAWLRLLSTKLSSTASRVVVDMAVHETVLYVPAFYLGTGLWRGTSLPDAYDNLISRWVPSTLLAWSIYGPAQVLNFTFVPSPLRPLFLSVMGFNWNVGFSILSNSANNTEETAHQNHSGASSQDDRNSTPHLQACLAVAGSPAEDSALMVATRSTHSTRERRAQDCSLHQWSEWI
uniref:Uncharacterized protein n=1 Tax=Tetraselmis chuii TaxID=63592 RepID=A0A7S1X4K0_9CHLO|mmetsp:Transcript_3152/g.5733  ORF Transcript_3152/g.5733 Transcript_3152/m.5733 type:complete len:247 (+) Transcript_3152:352-1092(+)